VRRDLTGTWRPPGEATVRRVLARIDADALDRAIGAWLAAQQPPPATPPSPPPRLRRQGVAVDGKTLGGRCWPWPGPRTPRRFGGRYQHVTSSPDAEQGAAHALKDRHGSKSTMPRRKRSSASSASPPRWTAHGWSAMACWLASSSSIAPWRSMGTCRPITASACSICAGGKPSKRSVCSTA
jgi:hypothetical protein